MKRVREASTRTDCSWRAPARPTACTGDGDVVVVVHEDAPTSLCLVVDCPRWLPQCQHAQCTYFLLVSLRCCKKHDDGTNYYVTASINISIGLEF